MSADTPQAGGLSADLAQWCESREPGWYHDIGYRIQDVLRGHGYETCKKGSKPDDPGWHECTCGEWEGYWSGFQPHVTDHLRHLLTAAEQRGRVAAARDVEAACPHVTTDPSGVCVECHIAAKVARGGTL